MNQNQPSTSAGQKGKLYKWTGSTYEEVQFDESVGSKIPVTEEAFEAVKAVRKSVQSNLGMRPELSIVASAMLLEAAKIPEVVEAVQRYGLSLYSKGSQSV